MAVSGADLGARLRTFSRSLSLAVIVVAALVLVGRATESAVPMPRSMTITTGSAWLLLLAGLSLWLRDLTSKGAWRRTSVISASMLVALAAVACTADGVPYAEAFGFLPWLAVRFVSPLVAVAFVILGFSLLVLDWETRAGTRPSQPLALAAVAIALAMLLAHAYRVPQLFPSAGLPPVPLQELILLLLASLAVLLARSDRGLLHVLVSDTTGGVLARTTPAAVLIVPVLIGWFTLRGQLEGRYDAATGTAILVLATVTFFSVVIFWIARSLDRADRSRTDAEALLRLRGQQQAAIAQLGQLALAGTELQILKEEAVQLIVSHLAADWGELLEPADEGAIVAIATGPDREAASSERAPFPTRVLASTQPVLVSDLTRDHWLRDPRLQELGVVSAALVAVRTKRTHGVLAVYARRPGAFTDDDRHLLQTVAAILAEAVQRKRSEEALRLSEEKFSGLFRSSPDAIVLVRPTDRGFLEVNDAFLEMTGFTREEVIGRPLDDPELWLDPEQPTLPDMLAASGVRNLEIRFRTKAGKRRVGLCSTDHVTLAGETGVLAVVRDISDRMQEQTAIERANVELERWVKELEVRSREISLLNDMGDLLQTCLTASEACAVTTRFARELLPGTAGALCLFVEATGVVERLAVWGTPSSTDAVFSPQDCWGLRRGRPHVVLDTTEGLACSHVRDRSEMPYMCVPMMALGEALGILHVREEAGAGASSLAAESKQRVIEAIAEHAALSLANLRLRDRLRRQSIRDQLTGLYNRWYLDESLERELLRAERTGNTVGLILVDLDGLKVVNDSHGHEAGDEVLRLVGRLFQVQLRASDFACRYGGDEFVLVLPEITLRDVHARAEDIRATVGSQVVWHAGRKLFPVSVSAGVAVYPDHGANAAQLLQAADEALYLAKAAGGDHVEASKARTS